MKSNQGHKQTETFKIAKVIQASKVQRKAVISVRKVPPEHRRKYR